MVEPNATLSAQDLADRVCKTFNCTHEPYLAIPKMLPVNALGYHGFTNSGGLRAHPTSNYNRAEKAGDFKVEVSLHPEVLPGHENKAYFARDFTEPTERALA